MVDTERLHEVADGIRGWASQPGSPYAGMAWDEVGGRLTVYRVPGDDHFDGDVLSLATTQVPVVLADTPRNEQTTQAFIRAIMAARDLPMRVYTAGPGTTFRRIEIRGEGDIIGTQTIMDIRYGQGVVAVSEGARAVNL